MARNEGEIQILLDALIRSHFEDWGRELKTETVLEVIDGLILAHTEKKLRGAFLSYSPEDLRTVKRLLAPKPEPVAEKKVTKKKVAKKKAVKKSNS